MKLMLEFAENVSVEWQYLEIIYLLKHYREFQCLKMDTGKLKVDILNSLLF